MKAKRSPITPSTSPPSIHVPLVVVVVISLLGGLTPVHGRVSYETWKYPCTNGRNATLALSEEFFQDQELEDKARKAFEDNLGHFYEVLSTKIGSLKDQLRVLLDSYFSARFPGEDQETYQGMSIDIIPQFDKDMEEMSSQNVQDVLDEVYENFARFSMYLFNAIKGEKNEKFMEVRFSDDYNLIHNNSNHGIAAILCKLHHLSQYFKTDEKLIAKLGNLRIMTKYLEAKTSGRHFMDFLVMRQFKENLGRIRAYFSNRSSREPKSPDDVIKERSERHADRELMVEKSKSYVDEEVQNQHLEATDGLAERDVLEKIFKSKRERAKPKKKSRLNRRIPRDQREYDVLVNMI